MEMIVDQQTIPLDKEGFLKDLNQWSPAVAEQLAKNEGITLSQDHWEIISLLQQFYREFELSPAMRPLVKYVGQQLGSDKGKSIYLLSLFPGSPAKFAAKIAGLPKPDNCL
ncbi:MAG: TusE/DsrC/DsvC family sulfur relay protein [Oceanicoccus sp.]|uniref:TusE/DsrC/DsvC family sulfur relay protein n=1 Tax=Oceanicoccus sp. TaxID=2691044 RepID=UPI00261DFCEB|nr:TusE/DsrC/DsvC family sulfur relay protein [Oceanicoccus sp.]MCP3908677.1 TusE/DsrC/DsvC family sulfur relay protein [Oceanicoccus sp.]